MVPREDVDVVWIQPIPVRRDLSGIPDEACINDLESGRYRGTFAVASAVSYRGFMKTEDLFMQCQDFSIQSFI